MLQHCVHTTPATHMCLVAQGPACPVTPGYVATHHQPLISWLCQWVHTRHSPGLREAVLGRAPRHQHSSGPPQDPAHLPSQVQHPLQQAKDGLLLATCCTYVGTVEGPRASELLQDCDTTWQCAPDKCSEGMLLQVGGAACYHTLPHQHHSMLLAWAACRAAAVAAQGLDPPQAGCCDTILSYPSYAILSYTAAGSTHHTTACSCWHPAGLAHKPG
jgi:hypothetical protein